MLYIYDLILCIILGIKSVNISNYSDYYKRLFSSLFCKKTIWHNIKKEKFYISLAFCFMNKLIILNYKKLIKFKNLIIRPKLEDFS